MEEYLMLLKMLGALVVIILLIYLTVRFGLRALVPGAGRGLVEIVQRIPLDSRGSSALILVKLEEILLLVGVAQGSITLLKELDAEMLTKLKDYPAAELSSRRSFAGLLSRLKNR
ncbi:MAG TPA: flagellar biosynthetic protein FliO [Bacillota bacterium]|nr:hypothetical protein [Bacillota bacterium]HOB86167.1 flagellar biosynthetic protein FliO [Bacillota bacterium]HOP68878.1 flagellar biosynthetic protein FliO [Bacillota bacterium]HPT33385.1 flagellar biosynthetic protein FliO [Bacillota bacterium]HPZ64162.1 flagellar biosynthetic protein FliO [Bacillota bacterium]